MNVFFYSSHGRAARFQVLFVFPPSDLSKYVFSDFVVFVIALVLFRVFMRIEKNLHWSSTFLIDGSFEVLKFFKLPTHFSISKRYLIFMSSLIGCYVSKITELYMHVRSRLM